MVPTGATIALVLLAFGTGIFTGWILFQQVRIQKSPAFTEVEVEHMISEGARGGYRIELDGAEDGVFALSRDGVTYIVVAPPDKPNAGGILAVRRPGYAELYILFEDGEVKACWDSDWRFPVGGRLASDNRKLVHALLMHVRRAYEQARAERKVAA